MGISSTTPLIASTKVDLTQASSATYQRRRLVPIRPIANLLMRLCNIGKCGIPSRSAEVLHTNKSR
jgi:hypothetical protein